MANSSIAGIRIAGIASAVPAHVRTLAADAELFGLSGTTKISESTGVFQRHVVTNGQCTSDLCQAAAEKLLADLGWAADSIGALIFVSQTPDYLLPATSCSLHGRLQLAKDCAAFDVNLGCSGYVYGLWLAASLFGASNIDRVLLLAGDTISQITSPQDRSVALLFGDAGTATALERDASASAMKFTLGTDGTGHEHLIVPVGGFRQRPTAETASRTEREGGNVRSDEDLYMNGAEIFSFTLSAVPRLVQAALQAAEWSVDDVDAVVMHQANRFMLEHLTKRLKLPREKVVLALENYGNTSSASIPLALTVSLAEKLRVQPMQLLLAGFGVGFSWAGATLTGGPMVVPDLVIVE